MDLHYLILGKVYHSPLTVKTFTYTQYASYTVNPTIDSTL